MKTILEYIINNHVSAPKPIDKCFVDIDGEDPNFKNYIRFRDDSWHKMTFILKDDLFKHDVTDTLNELKKIFKNDSDDIYVELPNDKSVFNAFKKAICISLNNFSVALKNKENEEAKELYNYFKKK